MLVRCRRGEEQFLVGLAVGVLRQTSTVQWYADSTSLGTYSTVCRQCRSNFAGRIDLYWTVQCSSRYTTTKHLPWGGWHHHQQQHHHHQQHHTTTSTTPQHHSTTSPHSPPKRRAVGSPDWLTASTLRIGRDRHCPWPITLQKRPHRRHTRDILRSTRLRAPRPAPDRP